MIIIRQGNPAVTITEEIKERKRFECRKCGCVWEAERGEYKSECKRFYSQYNEIYYHSTCPTCGKESYKSEGCGSYTHWVYDKNPILHKE